MDNRHPARLLSRTPLSHDICEVLLRTESPQAFAFRGGQFINVHFDGPDGRECVRSYSIASRRSDEGVIRLVMRTNADSLGAALWSRLLPGAPLVLSGPDGRLVLDADHQGDVVFCATGTGASPLIPMLEELAGRPREERRFVFWGIRDQRDLLAYGELPRLSEAASAALAIFLSREADGWTGGRGRIGPAVLDGLRQWRRPTFYLMGNPTMVRQVREGLVNRGVDRNGHIRHEAYLDA